MVEIVGTGNATDNVAGAGLVESVVQTADSMSRAGEGDLAEIGMNAAAVGLDLLGAALDPLGSLATAGIGWLIEHVSFLREPLDWFAGSPDNIKSACQSWNDVALKLDDIGKQQDAALKSQVQAWEQKAAEAFKQSHGQLGGEIQAMGAASTAVSKEISNFGTIVATVRGMIRDLISTFVFEVIRNAVIALAGSAVTFGGAAAAFAAWTVGRGAMVLGKITKAVTKVMQVAAKVLGRLKGLFGKVGNLIPGLKRFGRNTDSPAPSGSTGSGGPGLGQRMENWGQQKVNNNSDFGQKAKDGGKEFTDGYKNAGQKWDDVYQSKLDNSSYGQVVGRGQGVSDQYTPFKADRPDGSIAPHSTPSMTDGAFQTKFAGDLAREAAKGDELENEVPEGGNKEADSQRVEELRSQN